MIDQYVQKKWLCLPQRAFSYEERKEKNNINPLKNFVIMEESKKQNDARVLREVNELYKCA